MGKVRASRSDGPVIDIHCHRECAPAADFMKEAAPRGGQGGPRPWQPDHTGGEPAPARDDQAEDGQLDVRLADMDDMGVDVQAVAVAVYQYYYWADAELGAKVSRMMNEEFVESTAKYGDRFPPLGTVPLQDTEAAVQELRYLVQELGMRGIEIGTHVEGEEISTARLDPFWAEVENAGTRRRHPHAGRHPCATAAGPQLRQHHRPRLRGHPRHRAPDLQRRPRTLPGLKILVVHGGGYLPAYAGRIDHGWRAREDVREGVPRRPTSYLRKFFFDTMVFEPGQLKFLVDRYGADHVLLGTDYPYDMGDEDPLASIGAAAGLTRTRSTSSPAVTPPGSWAWR